MAKIIRRRLGQCKESQKDSVLQSPPERAIQAGHNTTLYFDFSTSYSNPDTYWHQQLPNQSPPMLLGLSEYKARVDSGRFSSVLSAEVSQVLLCVGNAELQDSALCLCVLSPHLCPQCAALCRKGRVCAGERLPPHHCLGVALSSASIFLILGIQNWTQHSRGGLTSAE
uniref:Uncharacterized protein n=1 Tax=Strix occidentalis caurina TaxID=311401 RepID=A0A8D0FJ45_STROC